ncbi:MAG: sensor histidine kinase [Flavobacteriales bacterium]|nr:sensor histidine kinase [Flavobacteriales bacterium]
MEALLFLLVVGILVLWFVLNGRLRTTRRERDRLLREKAELTKAKEELARENILLETHHLKFQMQPHALNNILSELKASSKKLERGMGALSSTLEYILYKGQMNLVKVADEVAFVRHYIQLHEMFVVDLDAVQLDESGVDHGSRYFEQECIPHLVTGYLIENAFKHGDRKHPDFLRIKLKLNEKFFQVHVANRIPSKPREGIGGLGLFNMKKRMDLLMPDRWRYDTHQEGEVYHAILTIEFTP